MAFHDIIRKDCFDFWIKIPDLGLYKWVPLRSLFQESHQHHYLYMKDWLEDNFDEIDDIDRICNFLLHGIYYLEDHNVPYDFKKGDKGLIIYTFTENKKSTTKVFFREFLLKEKNFVNLFKYKNKKL